MSDADAVDSGRDLSALDSSGTPWDLIVVGGGITGAGVLREAARFGYRALLVEQRDFTWGTSSRSSKMVHGGLRYLASGEFGLTRDAVRERERMLREAPGLVDNLYYIMPHFRKQFPGPKLFGLLLRVYDWMAGRRTRRFFPGDSVLRWVPGLRRQGLLGGTRFSDAVTDDSRLVLRILQEAVAAGGQAVNYVAADALEPQQSGLIRVRLSDQAGDRAGHSWEIQARSVVHATGAWTDRLRQTLGAGQVIRPLRGSHLIVPFWRLPVAATLSLIHPDDRRPVFVYPWEGVTVIGTTDLDHAGDLQREAVLDGQELDYLLEAANHAFPDARIDARDVISTWSGVRPVVSEGGTRKLSPSSEKREHVIWDDQGVISVAGGKLTTFRLIAREVLEKAQPYLPEKQLPNRAKGEDKDQVFASAPLLSRPAGITARQWYRLRGRYGARLAEVLEAGPLTPVGQTDTLLAELIWSARNESIVHLDDLLLRRTRLGLLLPRAGEHHMALIRRHCQPALGWSDTQWDAEVERYLGIWRDYYSLPPEQQEG